MSLLLEALKALADRPVPADGTAETAPSERPHPNLPVASIPAEMPSQVVSTDTLDTTSEQLLESAASAVAESLQEEQATESETLRTESLVAELKAPAEDEPVATWAEIWHQALMSPEEARSSADESTTEAGVAADESFPGDSPKMGEKLESIFAPWFAAHGLANEPAESAAPHAESHEHENAELDQPESSESPATEAGSEISKSPESDSIPSPYTPAAAHEHPSDPTWELYDRSAESLAAWGFRQAVPSEDKKPSEQADADLPIHSQTPAEYVPNQPPEQVKATPVETRDVPQRAAPTANEQSFSAPAAQETPKKKVRRPAAASQPVRMPLAASTELAAVLPSAQEIDEIRVSEPYLRLANRLLQSLRTARPQAIILASVDEASAGTLDIAQLAKAITLSEEGKLLLIQAQAGRPDLTRRLGIHPDQHPHWRGPNGGELYERIYCSSQGRIDLLPQEKLGVSADQAVDPLLIARCKRQYPLVLVDVGVVTSEVARSLVPQGDAALLVAVMQHTPREVAVQSNAILRRLGVRTAGCVLMEPRPATTLSSKFSL